MDITVERVLLAFPLDLSVEGIKCIKKDSGPVKTRTCELTFHHHKNDTVAIVGEALIDVELLPLFCGNVNVTGISLSDANINIALNDTTETDTTKTEIPLMVNIKDVALSNANVNIYLKRDSMHIGAYIGKGEAHDINLDLKKSIYNVTKLSLADSRINYNNTYERYAAKGFDANHIALRDLNVEVDSINYQEPNLRLLVKSGSFKEASGLTLKSMRADVKMDDKQLKVNGALSTPGSRLATNLRMDLNAFDDKEPGKLEAKLDASIGREDLMNFAADIPEDVKSALPLQPMNIKGEARGNLEAIDIPTLTVDIPSVLSIDAHGTAQGFMALADDMNSPKFRAHLDADMQTYNMNFVKKMLDKNTAQTIDIPMMRAKATLDARGSDYDIALRAAEGKSLANNNLILNAKVNAKSMAYKADADIRGLQLGHFVKGMGLGSMTGTVKAEGQGTDFFSRGTTLKAQADIKHLQYQQYALDNIKMDANVANGKALATIDSKNQLLNGQISLNSLLGTRNFQGTLVSDLKTIDLYKLGATKHPLTIGLCGHIDINTDMDQYYDVHGIVGDITITDTISTHHPEDIVLDLLTRRDTTAAYIFCGDFEAKLNAQGGYKWLMGCSDRIMAVVDKQLKNRTIDQAALRPALPKIKLFMTCGKENPIARIVKYNGIEFNDLYIDMETSREEGIFGNMHLYGLTTQGYQLDSIDAHITSNNDPMQIRYTGEVRNVQPNDHVFDFKFNGEILEHGISLNTKYFDEKNECGLKLGAEATMEEEGIQIHLTPNDPILGYETFSMNSDNYIMLTSKNRIKADVRLRSTSGTGIRIYSIDDAESLQDLTLSLHKLDIGRLARAVPYAPKMEGMLDGDFHFVQNSDESFAISTESTVNSLKYEGTDIGNIGTILTYMPKSDGSHFVDGSLLLDDNEIGTIKGSYNLDTEAINATMTLNDFPMKIVNGFIPDQIIGLEGFAEGSLDIKGTSSKPNVNGELFLNEGKLISVPYGLSMRFDDDPVRIINSQLLFENFNIYAYNDEPIIFKGYLDFHDLNNMLVDLMIRTRNCQIINAKETRQSELFGKAFVSFFGKLQGPVNDLRMRGMLGVLSGTDLTYILRDSPITTGNELEELVTFVDFNDSTQTTVQHRPTLKGLNMDMTLNVDQSARIMCALNYQKTNYIDLTGGGNLRMMYNPIDQLRLTGRYTLSNGEMKYELPFIPLKTFTIQDGSYVEFTGDPLNPRLNITATEENRASVNTTETSGIVTFKCGVEITRTLKDMGLQFIIDAPENQVIHSQLQAMSLEERGKVAVTMLTTGMYLNDGNSSDFTLNNALTSFLQGQISSVSGKALRTIDMSLGIDNATGADGRTHTDYSFKFAKRFWNNRVKISVGGQISTGPDVQKQNNSFFNNVGMEYRLSSTGNTYVNVNYQRNSYDWLEGYTEKIGAGILWKRKIQHLRDIFKKTSTINQRMRQERPQRTDGTQPAERPQRKAESNGNNEQPISDAPNATTPTQPAAATETDKPAQTK